MIKLLTTERAKINRNKKWKEHHLVPSWVNIEEVNLDQFFTRPEIAKICYNRLRVHMETDKALLENYHWIEPSAGGCAFYNLLPENNRTGIDVLPLQDDLVEADFLSWSPPKEARRHVVVGNPPFGYRAWLALAFMNHAAIFADYVGLILPMGFQSDGKGSPKLRVNGLRLMETHYLPPDSFTDAQGKLVKVNALFQIWQRGVNNNHLINPKSDWIDIFTVDHRKERLCGQGRIHDADFFLQRTFYKDHPGLVKSFEDVLYCCGYGLIFKKNQKAVKHCLNQVDWKKYSNLAAHNCRHVSMYHIYQAVKDHGFN